MAAIRFDGRVEGLRDGTRAVNTLDLAVEEASSWSSWARRLRQDDRASDGAGLEEITAGTVMTASGSWNERLAQGSRHRDGLPEYALYRT